MNNFKSEIINILCKSIESDDNKEIFITILSDITKLEIEEIKSIKYVKYPENISDISFVMLRMEVTLSNYQKKYMFLKIINKKDIEKTIGNYWFFVYQDEFKERGVEEPMNQIKIKKINEENFTDTLFIGIEDRKSNIAKCGTLIYITDFYLYLESKKEEIAKIKNVIKYLIKQGQELLVIGIIKDKGMNNFSVRVHS